MRTNFITIVLLTIISLTSFGQETKYLFTDIEEFNGDGEKIELSYKSKKVLGTTLLFNELDKTLIFSKKGNDKREFYQKTENNLRSRVYVKEVIVKSGHSHGYGLYYAEITIYSSLFKNEFKMKVSEFYVNNNDGSKTLKKLIKFKGKEL